MTAGEPVEEEYRTVAAAGTDPLERADRTDPAPEARLLYEELAD